MKLILLAILNLIFISGFLELIKRENNRLTLDLGQLKSDVQSQNSVLTWIKQARQDQAAWVSRIAALLELESPQNKAYKLIRGLVSQIPEEHFKTIQPKVSELAGAMSELPQAKPIKEPVSGIVLQSVSLDRNEKVLSITGEAFSKSQLSQFLAEQNLKLTKSQGRFFEASGQL